MKQIHRRKNQCLVLCVFLLFIPIMLPAMPDMVPDIIKIIPLELMKGLLNMMQPTI